MTLLKNERGRYQKIGYDVQRYIEDNDVNIQANSGTEDVIDQLVDRTTVELANRSVTSSTQNQLNFTRILF
jgi:hypothetical protein